MKFDPVEVEILRQLIQDDLSAWSTQQQQSQPELQEPTEPSELTEFAEPAEQEATQPLLNELLTQAYAANTTPDLLPWNRLRRQRLLEGLSSDVFEGVRLPIAVLESLADGVLQFARQPMSLARRLKTSLLVLLEEEPPWLEELVHRALLPQPARTSPAPPQTMEEVTARAQIVASLAAGAQMLHQLFLRVAAGAPPQTLAVSGGLLQVRWREDRSLHIAADFVVCLLLEGQEAGQSFEGEQQLEILAEPGLYELVLQETGTIFILDLPGPAR